MAELTEFQNACDQELSRIFALRGINVSERCLKKIKQGMLGEEEFYLNYEVEGGRIVIYIYMDEAEIIYGKERFMFELPDHSSRDELKREFLKKTKAILAAL